MRAIGKPVDVMATSIDGAIQRIVRFVFLFLAVSEAFILSPLPSNAEDFAALCADRTAIEKVYYRHRLGTKPAFEEITPVEAVEMLIRQDARKKAALRDVFHVEVSPAMIEAELHRIDSTTREPGVLAELKAALEGDRRRFARAVIEPLLVDRLLRCQFDNNDSLHEPTRRKAEHSRNTLIEAKANNATPGELLVLLKQLGSNNVSEISWRLQPTLDQAINQLPRLPRGMDSATPNANSTSSAGDNESQTLSFSEVPAALQRVLQAQLHRPGDVSAIVETPGFFTVYLCVSKTDDILEAATLAIPKTDVEAWLDRLEN